MIVVEPFLDQISKREVEEFIKERFVQTIFCAVTKNDKMFILKFKEVNNEVPSK